MTDELQSRAIAIMEGELLGGVEVGAEDDAVTVGDADGAGDGEVGGNGRQRTQGGLFNVGYFVDEGIKDFERVLAGDESDFVHRSGFPQLDVMTRGLRGGNVWVVASDPSVGRTSFMLRVVEAVCMDQNVPTLAYPFGLNPRGIADHLVFSRAGFSVTSCHDGHTPTKGDLIRIQQAAKSTRDARLFVEDSTEVSVDQICEKARLLHKTGRLGFIAMDDYQTLVRGDWDAESIFKTLKHLVLGLGVPLLILSRLEREAKCCCGAGPAAPCPGLSDLRDREVIEKYAGLIGFLNRTGTIGEGGRERVDFTIARNNYGRTGRVPIWYDPELRRFEPVDKSGEEQIRLF